MVGNLPGLVLPFLITLRIEAGRLTDAYFYAFAIAILVSSIVALALEASVMAAATHHRRLGARRFRAFTAGLLARSLLITTGAYLVIGAIGAGTVLLKGNWAPAQQRLCIELIGVFGVYLGAVALTSSLAGCLYAFDRFFVARVSIGLRAVLPVPVLFLAPPDATGLLLGAGALAAGEWLRAAVLALRLRASVSELEDDPVRPPAGPAPPAVWTIALPYGVAMVLFGASPVIDRIVAGSLEPGAVTTLDLAEKVFYAPVTVITSSVMLVAGARWARMSLDRPRALRDDFWQTVRRAAVLSSGLAVVLGAAAVLGLALVDREVAGVDAQTFCAVLAILLMGFPAAVVTNAGVRLMTVLQRTSVFPGLAVVSLLACIVGDVIGAALLGVPGIALAGTVWRTVNLVLFLHLSRVTLTRLMPASPPILVPGPLTPISYSRST